jgi:hypothetical protein
MLNAEDRAFRPSYGSMKQSQSLRLIVLSAILAFSIASSLIHYTHNFVAVDEYPQVDFISDAVTRAGLLLSWPVLTPVGVWGFWQYQRGHYRVARASLAAYSLVGLLTAGHFVSGNPDIPLFFYVTIYTDILAGVAVLAFVWWSARSGAGANARYLAKASSPGDLV